MTSNEMKQLGRTELLEMLLVQSRENEKLIRRVSQLEDQLADRTLRISKAGSIAEASLALNGIFEAAEESCKQYVENVERMYERQTRLSEDLAQRTQQRSEQMLEETRQQCEEMKNEAQQECELKLQQADQAVEDKWQQISARLLALYDSHQGLMELVSQGLSLTVKRGLDHEEATGQQNSTADAN